jgi:hypothetical protein
MCIDVINDTDNVNVLVQVDKLAANAEAYSVSRSLEAYLLMLFNCVLFNNAHDDIVNKILLPYARTIAQTSPYWSTARALRCWQRLTTPLCDDEEDVAHL